MTNILDPFPYFPEAGTGGYIYVGSAGLDARTNPITVYRDVAQTLPWAQPIRTVNGYPAYQGAKAGIFVTGPTVSLTVLDNNSRVVTNGTSFETNPADTLRSDLASTATGKGAALVGFSGFNGASNVDEALDWLRSSVNVKEFGAVGDGSTDDRTAIQAAIDYAYANGMDVVFPADIPDYYKISLNLVCRPGVSMRGVGGKAKIKNMNSGGATLMDRSVFLMGNMALNFTQLLTSYDCGTVGAGNTVTLTNIGDAANFAVGDQVVTLSTATSTSSGFTLNDYLHLNRITDISGAVITLQYPIDIAYAGGIALLSSVSTTSAAIVLPMYFIDNCNFENLDIEAPGGGMFNGYGGMYNVVVRDCIVDAAWGPYGNTMQYCKFTNNQWYFSRLMGEFALNSLYSANSDSSFCYKQNALFPAPEARFQFSEASRHCDFSRNSVNANGLVVTAGFSLFAFSAGSRNAITGNNITSDNAASAITVVSYVGRSTGPRCLRNTFSDNVVQMNNVRLFANFAMVDNTNINNRMENNLLTANTGDFAYSILLSNSYNNVLRGNTSTFGAIFFNDTASSGNLIANNSFPAGFSTNETSLNEQYYQQNMLRNNSSDAAVVKQTAVLAAANSVNAPASTATTVYSKSIGTSMATRDRYEFEFYIQPTGVANTKPIVFNLRDNTPPASDIALFSHTIPAASVGLLVVKTTVAVKAASAAAVTTTTIYDTTAGTTTTYVSSFSRPAADKSLSFNFIATPGASVSLSFTQITASYSNPYN